MNCDKVKRLLNRYVDKELGNKEVISLIEEHLNICSDCKAEFNSLILTKELIAQKERVTLQDDFLERLKDKLRERPQAVRIKWLPEAGGLARRLIPLPALIMILMFTLIFARMNGTNPVDEYIFGDLGNEEIAILGGYINNPDSLTNVLF